TGLRTTLTLLRGLFADSDATSSHHSHLLNEHELLGLNPHASLELDLDVVQQAYQALRLSAVPSEQQRAALVALFQHALHLVRGPFLDGFWLREETGFDVWVQQQQQQWQVRVLQLFDRLSSWQEEAFELEQARATLTRWLALDPLSEAAARRAGGPAGRTGRGFHPVGGEFSAGATGAAAGCAGGRRGRHRQNAAGPRFWDLGPSPRCRCAEWASLRDGGTTALSAAGRGRAPAAGGGKRAGRPAGRPVAGRTGASRARAAGTVPRSAFSPCGCT